MQPFAESSYRSQVGRLRRLATAALASFGVEPARVALLAHLENTTFRVDTADGDRYVLRIHRAGGDPFHPVRSPAEVESEMVWLDAVRLDLGDVAPEPVPTRDGGLLTVVGTAGVVEPRTCVLLRWVAGRFLDAGLTPTHLSAVGRLMAKLHTQAISFALPDGFVRPHLEDVTDVAAASATDVIGGLRGRRDAALVATVLDRVGEARRALGEDPEALTLIHGDLHQENYLFERGRVRLIDFDDCGWGHLLSDLAVTLSELDSRPDCAALSEGLLSGYRQVRPLPDGFDEFLPAFLSLRQLKIVLWLAEHRDHPDLADWPEYVGDGLDAIRRTLTR